MDDDNRKLESVKFAQESAKQILTLCTAVVTLTIGAVSVGALELVSLTRWYISIVLLCLIGSIVAGIVTLFALSGILSSKEEFIKETPLASTNYIRFGRLQFFLFVAAIVFMFIFGSLWPDRRSSNRKIEITVPADIECRVMSANIVCQSSHQ